jgi:hypothetical protein
LTGAIALRPTSARISVRSSIFAIGLSVTTSTARRPANSRVADRSAQQGILAYHDFIGGERDQRTARHRVVRHKDSVLGLVLPHRFGDLECGWTSPPGVQHIVARLRNR